MKLVVNMVVKVMMKAVMKVVVRAGMTVGMKGEVNVVVAKLWVVVRIILV